MGTADTRLACPITTCSGVEIHEGRREGCGNPEGSAFMDPRCPWGPGEPAEPLRMPEVLDDTEEYVWVEIVDGLTEEIAVAERLAKSTVEHEYPGWELHFDMICSMAPFQDGGDGPDDVSWAETTDQAAEGRRQFWRFEWYEA